MDDRATEDTDKTLSGHKIYPYPHPVSSDIMLITPVEEKSE
jgi:hypothetical protein